MPAGSTGSRARTTAPPGPPPGWPFSSTRHDVPRPACSLEQDEARAAGAAAAPRDARLVDAGRHPRPGGVRPVPAETLARREPQRAEPTDHTALEVHDLRRQPAGAVVLAHEVDGARGRVGRHPDRSRARSDAL